MATTRPIRVAWLGDPLGIPEPDPHERRRRRDLHGPARRLLVIGRETAVVLVAAIVLSLGMKTFLFQAFFIPSGSMENTMQLGDRVLVNKLAPGPFDINRGDIVVFDDRDNWIDNPETEAPMNPVAQALKTSMVFIGIMPAAEDEFLIKRVIGKGGDTVQCCSADGRIVVNGVPIDEPYVFDGNSPSDQIFSVTVPEGKLWVMGDHRAQSGDSRAHLDGRGGGFVDEDAVVGVAFSVFWPANRATLLKYPSEVFADVPDSKRK